MQRFWLGLALGLVGGASGALALLPRHPHMSAEALEADAYAPGGTVTERALDVAASDADRPGTRSDARRARRRARDAERSAPSTVPYAAAPPTALDAAISSSTASPSGLPASTDPSVAPWAAGLVAATAARSSRLPGAAPSGAAFEVAGTPAAPLSGLRWLTGGRPSPEPAMLVLVFLGIGERDTPVAVPPLVARVRALHARDVAVVGLAKACETYLAFDSDSVRWLHEQALDLPVAVLPGELERRYDVDRVPLAQVVVRGAVVWRGPPDALDAAELARIHGWVNPVAHR